MANNILYVKLNEHESPVFKEVRGKEYISYGTNNDYPSILLDLYDNASKHRAIVDGKADFLNGKGWESINEISTALNEAKLLDFINSANPSENLHDLSKKVFLDFVLFGGFYLNVIWNNSKNNFDLYHVDFSKIRTNKTQDKFFYSNDWKAYQQSFEKTGYKELEAFNPFSKKSGIFYYKTYRPNQGVYPLPEYIASIKYIEIEKEIANFHLNNIKNGFVGGTLIAFNNGEPTLEEQKAIEKQIKTKHTGTDNAGGIVLVFSEGKDKEPSVIPLRTNDFDKAFDTLAKTVRQEIFTGHRITSGQMFGVDGDSAFARNVIKDASEFFQNTYVTPRQQIIEGIFNSFTNLLGLGENLNIIELEMLGVQIPDALIATAFTPEEVRERLGLEKLKVDNVQGNKETINAINSLSQIVATKVLNQLTPNELRQLIGLQGIAGGEVIPTISAVGMGKQMTEQEAIDIFISCGENADDFEILEVQEMSFLDVTVTTLDASILDLLKNDPLISNDNISKALKIGVKEVEKSITNIIDSGLVEINKDGRVLTAEGEQIAKEKSPVEEILVKYKYDLRPEIKRLPGDEGLPILPNGRTRKFCENIINANLLYSREKIQTLQNDEGTNVWLTRGGFYHNPRTDLTTPSCRHIWQQVLVRKKNK